MGYGLMVTLVPLADLDRVRGSGDETLVVHARADGCEDAVRRAIGRIVDGSIPRPGEEPRSTFAAFGYAAQRLCDAIGEPLDNAAFMPTSLDALRAFDAVLAERGVGLRVEDLALGGPLLGLPDPDDYPMSGAIGELKYRPEDALPGSATEYFHRNCWLAASLPTLADPEARKALPPDRYMWGNDYPHDEGTFPFTREHLRQVFPGVSEGDMRKILAENAASLYRFDLAKLAPLAEAHGPTVAELAEPLTELPEHPNDALLRGLQPA